MASVHEMPRSSRRILGTVSNILTTDFCPWANRFVYWLKEPIGWFVLATIVSAAIGLFVSPIGWTLAAALSTLVVVGMAWPFLAVRSVHCGLGPQPDRIHEDQPCRMRLSVRNRLPIPVWGLAVEGFLDEPVSSSPSATSAAVAGQTLEQPKPTVALASVPPICTSEFSVTVRPQLRGHYPIETPLVACSFPFGIWTARRKLADTRPLTVWPKLFPIAETCPMMGVTAAEVGEGQRGGRCGDFVGVRQYRRGDSAKHIHWAASARTDSLIVTQRGGPQCVRLEVFVDTRPALSRQQLADRIRLAASVLVNLHEFRIPVDLVFPHQRIGINAGSGGRTQILDALTAIPAWGLHDVPAASDRFESARRANSPAILFTADPQGDCYVEIHHPGGVARSGGRHVRKRLPSGATFGEKIRTFWAEVRHGDYAA